MNNNLFTLRYWFNLNAGSLAPIIQKIFFVFLLILFAVAIYTRSKKKEKGAYFRIWKKLYFFSVLNLVIGLFLLFFTYEDVVFLSMRFWFLVWLFSMIFSLFLIYKEFKKIPEIKEKRKREEEFKKYIP